MSACHRSNLLSILNSSESEQFYRILPIRDLIHPDGPLNFLAHTPVNALQPDVGPRGTNSWAVDAATGTTLLRSSYFHLASLATVPSR